MLHFDKDVLEQFLLLIIIYLFFKKSSIEKPNFSSFSIFNKKKRKEKNLLELYHLYKMDHLLFDFYLQEMLEYFPV